MIKGDRWLLTPQHYNPRLRAFITATEALLGEPDPAREQLLAQGITPGLVADLYRYDMTGLTQAFTTRGKRFLRTPRRFDFDRALRKRQMDRFTRAIWGLRRGFPTSIPKIATTFGVDSVQQAQWVAMQRRFESIFHTGQPDQPEDARQWITPGTELALCELFELAYLYSHDENVMVGYDAWHDLVDNADTFQMALDEFIAAANSLLLKRAVSRQPRVS